MIDLYTWPTPNGHKVHIMLEELELPYNVIPINIGKGDQFDPEFLKISPNNKMPAMVDPDSPDGKPIAIFESAAILLYLAEKSGQLMPQDMRGRYAVMQWLMFQMGSVGPMLGQAHHFRGYAQDNLQYAVDRYTNEAGRIYNVIDNRLKESTWIASDDYTIADIAIFPWLRSYERQGQDLNEFPQLKKWFGAIEARPAVVRGVAVLAEARRQGELSDEERENLFGGAQYVRR